MQENMTLTSRTWTTIHEMSEVTRLFKVWHAEHLQINYWIFLMRRNSSTLNIQWWTCSSTSNRPWCVACLWN